MSEIPQEWIEAGAAGLVSDPEECSGLLGGYVALWNGCDAEVTPQGIAHAVLTAVLPLIREALAAQIEARLHHGCADYECVHAESHMAVSRAAAIVRGEV